jgi:hypothetical protein
MMPYPSRASAMDEGHNPIAEIKRLREQIEILKQEKRQTWNDAVDTCQRVVLGVHDAHNTNHRIPFKNPVVQTLWTLAKQLSDLKA